MGQGCLTEKAKPKYRDTDNKASFASSGAPSTVSATPPPAAKPQFLEIQKLQFQFRQNIKSETDNIRKLQQRAVDLEQEIKKLINTNETIAKIKNTEYVGVKNQIKKAQQKLQMLIRNLDNIGKAKDQKDQADLNLKFINGITKNTVSAERLYDIHYDMTTAIERINENQHIIDNGFNSDDVNNSNEQEMFNQFKAMSLQKPDLSPKKKVDEVADFVAYINIRPY